MPRATIVFACLCLLACLAMAALAQAQPSLLPGSPERAPQSDDSANRPKRSDVLTEAPDYDIQLEQLIQALARLPIAAGLACVLALRPRRRGTPSRKAPVIQTQIILAIVGAMVMLVVGSSLARAFGIVGAAGLVRYRARIDDPKDAGVMLSTLAIGLASGVGLWFLALFSTIFVLTVLWIVESFEPKARQLFLLTIKAKDPAALKPRVEQLLARHRIRHEIRTTSQEELGYEVQIPIDKKTDQLSDVILALGSANATAVEWEEKKEKK